MRSAVRASQTEVSAVTSVAQRSAVIVHEKSRDRPLLVATAKGGCGTIYAFEIEAVKLNCPACPRHTGEKATVTMIMAAIIRDSVATSGLEVNTILQLQRLVLLNNESRDAYQLTANLAKDPQLAALAEHTALDRHSQSLTLQNILWCNGNESKSRSSIDTGCDRRIYRVLNESPARLLTAVIDELLEIDELVYSGYAKVKGTIQGRGIRQLLSEQAVGIQRLRTSMLDLRQKIAKQNSSEGNRGG